MDLKTLIALSLSDYEAELERKNRARKHSAKLAAMRAELARINRRMANPLGLTMHVSATLTTRKYELETALGLRD